MKYMKLKKNISKKQSVNKSAAITKQLAYKKTALVCIMAIMAVNTAQANQQKQPEQAKIAVDATNSTTQTELATLKVFYDLCPTLLKKKQKKTFYKKFNALLVNMLPNISQPKKALAALADDKKFNQLVKQAAKDTNKFTKKENLAVCEDIVKMNP